jgi:hypothetical protein
MTTYVENLKEFAKQLLELIPKILQVYRDAKSMFKISYFCILIASIGKIN